MSKWRKCSVANCLGISLTRGLCNAHYKRLMIHGDVQAQEPVRRSPHDRKSYSQPGTNQPVRVRD